jgi:hypothetical protein
VQSIQLQHHDFGFPGFRHSGHGYLEVERGPLDRNTWKRTE